MTSNLSCYMLMEILDLIWWWWLLLSKTFSEQQLLIFARTFARSTQSNTNLGNSIKWKGYFDLINARVKYYHTTSMTPLPPLDLERNNLLWWIIVSFITSRIIIFKNLQVFYRKKWAAVWTSISFVRKIKGDCELDNNNEKKQTKQAAIKYFTGFYTFYF